MVLRNWLASFFHRTRHEKNDARQRIKTSGRRVRNEHRYPAVVIEHLEPRRFLFSPLDVTQTLVAPQISGLSVQTGTTLGGESVTISGSGFSQVSTVLFGTMPAASFTINSSSSISVVTPAHIAGRVDVAVVTLMGSSTTTTNTNNQFLFQVPTGLPEVSSVSPGTATTSGGSTITITGSNFTSAKAVSFGDVPATNFVVNSPFSITAVAPAHVSGQVHVQVSTAGGTSAANSDDRLIFTIPTLPPVVTGLSVSSGSTSGGNSVNIFGANFTDATGVTFGGVAATSFVINSANSILAIVPAEIAGTIDVRVSNSSGTSGTVPADNYTFQSPAPVLSHISVSRGETTGGDIISITGANFQGVTKVLFGTIPSAGFVMNSSSQLTVVVPAAPPGTVDVTVQTIHGTTAVSAANQFTFVLPPPSVTSLSRTSGPIAGGTEVTISGQRLSDASAVRFGSHDAISFKLNMDGTITAIAPSGVVGVVDITVISPAGTSTVSGNDQFTYTNPPPVVTGVSEATSNGSGEATVTITGSYFIGATRVQFGAVNSSSFTINSDGSITALVPVEPAGVVDVVVSNAAGRSTVSSADQFIVPPSTTIVFGSGPNTANRNPPNALIPLIDALEMNGGSILGGDTVTIDGVGFSLVTKVLFGTVPSPSFHIVDDNTLTAVVPAHSAGAADITLQSPAGNSAPSNVSLFTFSDPSALPSISEIHSLSNSLGPGAVVEINGEGFADANAVDFGGITAVFVVQSTTSILAVIPNGVMGAVNVSVTTPTGTSRQTSFSNLSLSLGITIPPISGPDYVVTSSGVPDLPLSCFPYGISAARVLYVSDGGVAAPFLPLPTGTPNTSSNTTVGSTNYGTAIWNFRTTNLEVGSAPNGSVIVHWDLDISTFKLAVVSTGDENPQLISTVITVTDQSQSLDMILASNGTGVIKTALFQATRTHAEYYGSTTRTISSDQVFVSINTNTEIGHSSAGATDTKSLSNARLNLSRYTNFGTTPNFFSYGATPGTVGQATFTRKGFDTYLVGDSNNTSTDIAFSQLIGWDRWYDYSSGTYALFNNGQSDIKASYVEDYSGNDSYLARDVNTTTTTTRQPSGSGPSGSTTISEVFRLNDSGFDEYTSTLQGDVALRRDRSTPRDEWQMHSDDGYEVESLGDSGWILEDLTYADGSVVAGRDDFSDQVGDQSHYSDTDFEHQSSAAAGYDISTSSRHDGVTFSTSDQVALTDTWRNAYGTATVVTFADKPGDSGTLTFDPYVRHDQTLGFDGSFAQDIITSDAPIHEKDTATDPLLKIIVRTIGQIAPGKFVDLTETFTSTESLTTTDDWEDPLRQTEIYDSASDNVYGSESDTASDRFHTSGTDLIEDKFVGTVSTTLNDGTVVVDTIDDEDTDTIVSTEDDSDSETNSVSSGPTATNSDEVKQHDKVGFVDRYTIHDQFTRTVTIPVSGGTLVLTEGDSVQSNGVLTDSDELTSDDNTSNPSVDFRIEDVDLTNSDTGTETVSDSIVMILTDAATGVVTTLIGSDGITDTFTDDDGDRVDDATATGVAPTDTETAHAIATDHFTERSSLTLSIVGNPAPGLTIEFIDSRSTSGNGSDSEDDEFNSGSAGNGTETDQFHSKNHETESDTGHWYLTKDFTTNSGYGNYTSFHETDMIDFNGSGIFDDQDNGEEDASETNGAVSSDTEHDTDIGSIQVRSGGHEVVHAQSTATWFDPKTGFLSLFTMSDERTEDIQENDAIGITDLHVEGPTITDTINGDDVIGETDSFHNLERSSYTLQGVDPFGNVQSVTLTTTEEIHEQSEISNDVIQLAGGARTDTFSVRQSVNSQTTDGLAGTMTYVDPASGQLFQLSLNDQTGEILRNTETDTDDSSTSSTGTTTNSPTSAETGSDITWIVSQDQLTPINTDGLFGTAQKINLNQSEMQTSANGVVTEHGIVYGPQALNISGVGNSPMDFATTAPENQTTTPNDSNLTLAQKQVLWAKQAEIAQLQTAVQNFQKDLTNRNLSPIARKNLQQAVADTQTQLRALIIEANGVVPSGNLANGNDPVTSMSLMQKLRVALQAAINSGKLSEDVKTKLQSLIEPANLAMAAAFIGGYAALHATPLAPGIAVLDAYMLGSSAAETGNAIFQLYLDLDSATTQQELDQAARNLSSLLSGPIADAMLKVLVLGAAKGAREFNKRYKIELPDGVADGSRLNMNVPVPKIKKREFPTKVAPNKKAYAKTADGEYWVAKHKDFTPRGPDIRSHHGVMSAWMEKHFPGYKAGEAPTVHMPTGQHYNTTGVYNKWRAEIERRTGSFDWGKVTEADMRALSEKMFDAGKVPQPIRDMYWQDFDRMLKAFAEGRAK